MFLLSNYEPLSQNGDMCYSRDDKPRLDDDCPLSSHGNFDDGNVNDDESDEGDDSFDVNHYCAHVLFQLHLEKMKVTMI